MLTPVSQGTGVTDAAEVVPEHRKCDVAVIFVHGIGAQVRGETLLSWAEPMLEVLDQAGPGFGLTTRVASADDLGGDAPEITLEITRNKVRQTTWLLTEARWAEAFHPSLASDVLQWAGRFALRAARRGIVTLVSLLWFATKRLRAQVKSAFPRPSFYSSKTDLLLYAMAYVVLMPYVLLFVALIVILPALVVLAVFVVLTLIVMQWVPFLGKRVSPLVAGLVTSVGDAHAYRDREIQAAAMRQVLLARLADASKRARNIVVVAHSQGAAISCRAFLEKIAPWPTCLVTLGAGTSLLNDKKSVDQWRLLHCPQWVNAWTLLDPVPAGPVGDDARAVNNRLLETLWHQTLNGGFRATSQDGLRELCWAPGAGPECWSGTDDLVQQARRSRQQIFSKTGIISTSQPVSEPLNVDQARAIASILLEEHPRYLDTPIPRVFETPGPTEWPVANRWSVVRDHTSYAANLSQIQYPLARLLLNQVQATEDCLPALSERAEEWHVIRVRALAMSRLIAVVTAAAVVGLVVAVDARAAVVGTADWTAGHWELAGWILGGLGEGIGALAGLTGVGVAVFAILSGFLGSAWGGWHRRESLRLCKHPAGARVYLGFSGWMFGTCYLLALAFSFVSWWTLLSSESYALALFVLVPSYLLWALIWPFVGLRPRRLPPRG